MIVIDFLEGYSDFQVVESLFSILATLGLRCTYLALWFCLSIWFSVVSLGMK